MSVIISCRDDNSISQAAQALARGEVVIFPTETVYALAARADSDAAIGKIFAAKQRDPNQALTLMTARSSCIAENFLPDPRLDRLIEKFSPGPITFIAGCKPKLLSLSQKVNQSSPGWLGLRIPAHDWALRLLSHLDFPIVATSCNLSGKQAATNIADIDQQVANHAAVIVDGGEAQHKLGSTIIKLTTPITLIRQGPIIFNEITCLLGSAL